MNRDVNDRNTLCKYAILAGLPFAFCTGAKPFTTICTAVVICFLIYIAGLKLPLYRNCFDDPDSDSNYLFEHCCAAEPAIPERLPAGNVFFPSLNRINMQMMEPISRTTLLWQLVPDSFPEKGYNNNTTTSVKNGTLFWSHRLILFLRLLGEELGFIGSCVVIALLLLIVLQCILIGIRAEGPRQGGSSAAGSTDS